MMLATRTLTTLLLALGCGLSLSAQVTGEGRSRPEPAGCACSADGADCPFGSSGGCQVTHCSSGICECNSGYCRWGFPRAAECVCHAPIPLDSAEPRVGPGSAPPAQPPAGCDVP